MNTTTVTVAVLGLGEAGGAIARDLVASGAIVRAYDPVVLTPAEMVAAQSEADATAGADLVLSVNSSKAAADALSAGVSTARSAVWADMNTASPETKLRLAKIAARHDVAFADVSIMAPVPGRGLKTPMLASGVGAGRAAALLNGLGGCVEVLDASAGAAAQRKLLRSVFFKGMAAAVVEALEAGRAAGCENWLRGNIIDELSRADESTVDRLERGTMQHAVRRADEMAAAAQMLTELGVQPVIASASCELLSRLAAQSIDRHRRAE